MTDIAYTYTLTNGTAADADQVQANFTSVSSVVNGNLTDGNIKAAAGIALSKLATTGALSATSIAFGGAAVTGVINLASATTAAGGIYFGADTNLYRSAANVLKTDDAFLVGDYFRSSGNVFVGDTATTAVGSPGGWGISTSGYMIGSRAASSPVYLTTVSGDTAYRFRVDADGKITWGDGSAADTNLYRAAANVLETDDDFASALELHARYGAAAQVTIGGDIGSGIAGIQFGSALDTNLYRDTADVLKTDDDFAAALELHARYGTAPQVTIGGDIGSGIAGIQFGSALDTNLYRNAADTLKTDDGLIASGGVVTKVKAGTPSDTDLVAGMRQSGAIIVDTSASKIWVRVGATWKSVTVA